MPPLTDQQLITRYKIKTSDKILDIGGSLKQHTELNIDTLIDLIPPDQSLYNTRPLLARNFVQLDVQTQKLPFPDNSFDFCLCTHVVEDLPSPFLILDEMSRVAKRGYLATPSRGIDIVFSDFDLTNWLTGARRVPGLSHHYWLFENIDDTLTITPKNYPLLYTSEFQYVNWAGPDECQFYWEDKINYSFFDSIEFPKLIENYRKFAQKNKSILKKGRVLYFVDQPPPLLKAYLKLLLRRGRGFNEK